MKDLFPLYQNTHQIITGIQENYEVEDDHTSRLQIPCRLDANSINNPPSPHHIKAETSGLETLIYWLLLFPPDQAMPHIMRATTT